MTGKSGAELYMEITGQEISGKPYREDPEEEYWCGYVYCYAQWFFGCSFHDLVSSMPVFELLQLYHHRIISCDKSFSTSGMLLYKF